MESKRPIDSLRMRRMIWICEFRTCSTRLKWKSTHFGSQTIFKPPHENGVLATTSNDCSAPFDLPLQELRYWPREYVTIIVFVAKSRTLLILLLLVPRAGCASWLFCLINCFGMVCLKYQTIYLLVSCKHCHIHYCSICRYQYNRHQSYNQKCR